MTKSNKKISKQAKKATPKIRHLKAYILLLSAALALFTIVASLFEFENRVESQGLLLFLLGLLASSIAPAYYIISPDTPTLLRVSGIIAFSILLVFAGVFITAVLSLAFL